ncbi:hypothetical protein D3C87_1789650 [compost metagenome]
MRKEIVCNALHIKTITISQRHFTNDRTIRLCADFIGIEGRNRAQYALFRFTKNTSEKINQLVTAIADSQLIGWKAPLFRDCIQ